MATSRGCMIVEEHMTWCRQTMDAQSTFENTLVEQGCQAQST
jgi:hypothetical protein